MTNWAIILAAGRSQRMGRCKTQLPWVEGMTLLAYQVAQWQAADFQPVVVLGSHNYPDWRDRLSGAILALNPNPEAGKTTSILAGLRSVPPEARILAISAVDQPRPAWVYATLRSHHIQAGATITAPVYRAKLGHPLLFHRTLRSHLENLREETLGLRQVMQDFQAEIQYVPFENAIVCADINTPEVYQNSYQTYVESCHEDC